MIQDKMTSALLKAKRESMMGKMLKLASKLLGVLVLPLTQTLLAIAVCWQSKTPTCMKSFTKAAL